MENPKRLQCRNDGWTHLNSMSNNSSGCLIWCEGFLFSRNCVKNYSMRFAHCFGISVARFQSFHSVKICMKVSTHELSVILVILREKIDL